MNKKIVILLIVAVVIFAGLAGLGIFNWQSSLDEITDLEKEVASLVQDKDSLQDVLDEKEERLTTMQQELDLTLADLGSLEEENKALTEQAQRFYIMPAFLEEELAAAGYAPADLLIDLELHPELIPYEGILGGTPYWYAGESAVLTDKYVLGYFEDGHFLGYGLLAYEFKNGEIEWTLLDAYIPGSEE